MQAAVKKKRALTSESRDAHRNLEFEAVALEDLKARRPDEFGEIEKVYLSEFGAELSRLKSLPHKVVVIARHKKTGEMLGWDVRTLQRDDFPPKGSGKRPEITTGVVYVKSAYRGSGLSDRIRAAAMRAITAVADSERFHGLEFNASTKVSGGVGLLQRLGYKEIAKVGQKRLFTKDVGLPREKARQRALHRGKAFNRHPAELKMAEAVRRLRKKASL